MAGAAGERIVAVSGQPVSREQPPQALLVHQAGAKVALTLRPRAAGARRAHGARHPARRRNPGALPRVGRDATAPGCTNSGGRVGYFHLPDMMSAGFAEFHRYFATECDRDALIVDVRYNRGGHVSQLLLEKVARKRIG